MSDIFLSYDSRDLDRVNVLAAALESQGWTIFFDRTIPSGKTWRQFIVKEIDESRCMVVAWSTHSVNSHGFVRKLTSDFNAKFWSPFFWIRLNLLWGFGSIQAASLVGWQDKTNSSGYLALCKALTERIGSRKPSASSDERANHHSTNYTNNTNIRWFNQLTGKAGKITVITAALTIMLWYVASVLFSPKEGEHGSGPLPPTASLPRNLQASQITACPYEGGAYEGAYNPLDQMDLLANVKSGKNQEAFLGAIEQGDTIFGTNFNREQGGGAYIGEN